MTDHIEPALTQKQWQDWAADRARWADDLAGSFYSDTVGADAAECAENIAYNNAALPDDDPRKITRETVAQLRTLVEKANDYWDDGPRDEGWQSPQLERAVAAGRALIDALESYLPPETP